jgi:ATP-dependent Clp protease ATP-binding subunit ClpA
VSVFERFTVEARQVVAQAEVEARAFGHPWLGTEHLLLGVLARPETQAAHVLADLGVSADGARAALGALVGRGGFREADAAALRTVGIDLEQVRHAAEATFGPGALDRAPARRCRRGRRGLWRRRRAVDSSAHLPFAPRAKRALERARAEADARRHTQLNVDHLLVGLLDPKANTATEVLCRLGVSPGLVRTRLLQRLDRAA